MILQVESQTSELGRLSDIRAGQENHWQHLNPGFRHYTPESPKDFSILLLSSSFFDPPPQ